MNPPLSDALTARLAAREPLTEEDVYRLHARHIYMRDVKMLESLQQRLRNLLEDTAQAAVTAGQSTGRYSRALRRSHSDLNAASSLEAMRHIVDQLLGETVRMEFSTQALAEKLEARGKEVSVLTEQLERAQTERYSIRCVGSLIAVALSWRWRRPPDPPTSSPAPRCCWRTSIILNS
jgi:hypothetical protein